MIHFTWRLFQVKFAAMIIYRIRQMLTCHQNYDIIVPNKEEKEKTIIGRRKPVMINAHTKNTCALFSGLDLSRYIISYCAENEKQITNLALQKILYYIQGYFFKFYQIAAVSDDFCKWPYGPVIPSVYYEFCYSGANPIVIDADSVRENLHSIDIEKGYKRLISTVVDKCLDFDNVFDLVEQTHSESPWKNELKMGSFISDDAIQEFFLSNNPLSINM